MENEKTKMQRQITSFIGCYCSRQCQSLKQTYMPKQVFQFLFILRIKKKQVSLSQNHTLVQLLHTKVIFLLTVQTAYTYIFQRLDVVSTSWNKSILAPLAKQTQSSYSPCDFGTLELLPTPVAWLRYFQLCLLRSCCCSKSHILNTYKSHRYTWQLKKHKEQHSNYTYTHSCSFLYFTLVS